MEESNVNPPLETGYGFVSPSIFASWASTILTGRSLGRIQFLNRCGMTAWRAFGFAVLSATWTASPKLGEPDLLRP